MLRNRLFNLFLAIALALAVALTVQEAFATTTLTSQRNAVMECAALPSPWSVHTKYVKESRMFVLYTEDGPAGVDGGLMELMSAYPTCSR